MKDALLLWPAAITLGLLVGCGGDSVCGNGAVEPGEQCDDGNAVDNDGCTNGCLLNVARPVCGNGKIERGEECDDGNTESADGCTERCTSRKVEINWYLISTEFPGFNETCGGVSADKVELRILGPVERTERKDCGLSETTVSGLPLGDYTVNATVFGKDGVAITKGVATAGFSVTSDFARVDLDIPFADFSASYSGTFFFRTKWAGVENCDEVTSQRLIFERDGAPLSGATESGTPVDGSRAGNCRPFGMQAAQSVKNLTWGPMRVTVVGLSASGEETHRQVFDAFAGAGISNPEVTFDVARK
ncbi:MAG: DUF4215 domain-containing protein [Deltaproteobacteria bacterium]|nr:DUF4215 domain-containing protein [Deltaproteobacteria bacterium]